MWRNDSQTLPLLWHPFHIRFGSNTLIRAWKKRSEKHESILRGDRPLLSHEFIYPSTQQIFTEPPENGDLSYGGGGMGGKASFRLQQRSQSVGRFLRQETWELEYEIILLMPEGRHGGSQESFLRRGLMKPIIQQPSHLRAWSRKSESIVQPELTFTAETGVNSFVLFLQEAGRPRHEEREGTDFQVSTTVTKLDNSILLLYYIWGSL